MKQAAVKTMSMGMEPLLCCVTLLSDIPKDAVPYGYTVVPLSKVISFLVRKLTFEKLFPHAN